MFRLNGKHLKMGVIAESEAERSKLARNEHTNRLHCPSVSVSFCSWTLLELLPDAQNPFLPSHLVRLSHFPSSG